MLLKSSWKICFTNKDKLKAFLAEGNCKTISSKNLSDFPEKLEAYLQQYEENFLFDTSQMSHKDFDLLGSLKFRVKIAHEKVRKGCSGNYLITNCLWPKCICRLTLKPATRCMNCDANCALRSSFL